MKRWLKEDISESKDWIKKYPLFQESKRLVQKLMFNFSQLMMIYQMLGSWNNHNSGIVCHKRTIPINLLWTLKRSTKKGFPLSSKSKMMTFVHLDNTSWNIQSSNRASLVSHHLDRVLQKVVIEILVYIQQHCHVYLLQWKAYFICYHLSAEVLQTLLDAQTASIYYHMLHPVLLGYLVNRLNCLHGLLKRPVFFVSHQEDRCPFAHVVI